MTTSHRHYILTILAIAAIATGAACQKKATTNTNTVVNDSVDTSDTITNVPVDEDETEDSVNANRNTNTSTTVDDDDEEDTEDSNSNTNTSTTDDEDDDAATTSNGSITVTSISAKDEVTSPFTVSGTAKNSGKVFVRIVNSSGKELFTESTTPRNGSYKISLSFEFTHTTSGAVEVYQEDADGKEVGLVRVPITFSLSSTNTNTETTANANISPDEETSDTTY